MQGIPPILSFRKRLEHLNGILLEPDFYKDNRRAAQLNREQQKLSKLVNDYDLLEKKIGEQKEHLQSIGTTTDLEWKALLQEELSHLEQEINTLREKVLIAMLPEEQEFFGNVILEIRAGTGGDEASLFAASLFRMYCRYAEGQSWGIEYLHSSPSECGGFKEVAALIKGENAHTILRFESGVHRVQRIPETEANGRIHTSTVTVAILPEAQEVDLQIQPEELEISICRASGPGGQGVNTTDSAVQILHKPTGMIIACADERSQQKNKTKALTVLRARLLKKKKEEEQEKYAENRRSQIGSGDRSERIRTYNFPQNRVTDHRINLTLYSLPKVMEGEISELLQALEKADLQKKMETMLKTLKA